jgi:hypothetical protein
VLTQSTSAKSNKSKGILQTNKKTEYKIEKELCPKLLTSVGCRKK